LLTTLTKKEESELTPRASTHSVLSLPFLEGKETKKKSREFSIADLPSLSLSLLRMHREEEKKRKRGEGGFVVVVVVEKEVIQT